MASDILYQVLLSVLIVAVVALIFVLVRMYMILTDVNKASKIISEKVSKVGVLVDHIVEMLESARETVKGAMESIKSVSKIKDRITDFWEDNHTEKHGSNTEKKG
jgi:hypothetical protein